MLACASELASWLALMKCMSEPGCTEQVEHPPGARVREQRPEQPRAIAEDMPRRFQRLNAAGAGGLRQSHPRRDLADAGARIVRENLQDRRIDSLLFALTTAFDLSRWKITDGVPTT